MTQVRYDGVELIPLEGCSSKIWKFFGFPGKDGEYIEKDKKKHKLLVLFVVSGSSIVWKHVKYAALFKQCAS